MSVQNEKAADQDDDQRTTEQDKQTIDHDDEQQRAEKPEPDEEQKEKAAQMMTAYEDRPTLVLPGTGGMVSGTAVNDWLDDDGNPKGVGEKQPGSDDQGEDALGTEEQIEKDKAWNVELRKAAKQNNKGEKS